MKFLQIFILINLAVFFSAFSQNNENCSVVNSSFDAGEEINYVLSYTWLFIWTDVGEATFTVKNESRLGQNALHLHTFGMSYSFYDWFFKVRDIYESWVDPISLKPIHFNRDINEGGYTNENEYKFNRESNLVNARIRRRGGENKYYDIPVTACTYDVVSAIYVSRNIDFKNIAPGKSFPISVLLDREIFSVRYTFLNKEEKHIRGVGNFKTLKFRVELIAGDVFKEGQYLYVWVTDDQNRMPIYIESPIRVGSVRARVNSWKGLVHPLDSKID
jgi:hypothetical protein